MLRLGEPVGGEDEPLQRLRVGAARERGNERDDCETDPKLRL
jgi:hypothetical protein